MSTTTTNLGLVKPTLIDTADITTMNGNWDKIDQEIPNKLPLNGGTLSGNLTIKTPSYPQINLNSNATKGDVELLNGTHNAKLISRNVIGDLSNQRALLLGNSKQYDLTDTFQLLDDVDGVSKAYKIHGEHNKPYGTYQGTGDATRRTINLTNGNLSPSKMLIIQGNQAVTIVNSTGGYVIDTTSNSVSHIPLEEIWYTDGKLTLATTNDKVNHSVIKYNYQAL